MDDAVTSTLAEMKGEAAENVGPDIFAQAQACIDNADLTKVDAITNALADALEKIAAATQCSVSEIMVASGAFAAKLCRDAASTQAPENVWPVTFSLGAVHSTLLNGTLRTIAAAQEQQQASGVANG